MSYLTQEQYGRCFFYRAVRNSNTHRRRASTRRVWYEQVAEPLNRLQVEQKVVYPQRNDLVFSLNEPSQLVPKPQAVASLGRSSTPLRFVAYVCALQHADDVPLFLLLR